METASETFAFTTVSFALERHSPKSFGGFKDYCIYDCDYDRC